MPTLIGIVMKRNGITTNERATSGVTRSENRSALSSYRASMPFCSRTRRLTNDIPFSRRSRSRRLPVSRAYFRGVDRWKNAWKTRSLLNDRMEKGKEKKNEVVLEAMRDRWQMACQGKRRHRRFAMETRLYATDPLTLSIDRPRRVLPKER